MRDAGLPEKMNIQDLRHTFATIALQQGGTPAEVAEALGHSSPATTLKIYAHALPGASGRMGDLVVGD
ncbi:MAG: tyrosine-type recombinase/integrase [Chloroflexi bacterium]|nr:tyrosine-type recombinase/integrase [Chloroflexota bacterium]MCI0835122.1 tyrosine-type recombinase/integrase [Chloroflexota bacterium]MCI0874682.1 tyrosine-type recombinase/integrase [Chloroflexota bacterium]